MRIIKEPAVRAFWRKHPDAEPSLAKWLDAARKASWSDIREVRRDYPAADGVLLESGNVVTVFNIAGNKYRLIVSMKYKWSVIYIRDFLTHAEYSKDAWKKRH